MEIGVYAAKTQLSALIDRVAAGEDVVITRHGRAVARLAPVGDTAPASRPLGLMRGKIEIAPGFYTPMTPEELALWEDGPVFSGNPGPGLDPDPDPDKA